MVGEAVQSCLIVGWDAFTLDGPVGQGDFADVVFLEVVTGSECSLRRLAGLTVPVFGWLLAVVSQDAAGAERHGAKHQD
jgi:hypothetical protein